MTIEEIELFINTLGYDNLDEFFQDNSGAVNVLSVWLEKHFSSELNLFNGE